MCRRDGWWSTVVILLVGGRARSKLVHHPAHLKGLAEESGNLSFMLENEKPQLNHAGSQILFCQSSEKGVGVFVANIISGQKKMVFEEKEIHFGMGPHGVLRVFPWSPDDRWITYAHQGEGSVNGEYSVPNETALTICGVNTEDDATTLEVPFGEVSALDWLSPDMFVYASGINGETFELVRREADGQWRQMPLKKPAMSATKVDKRFCSLRRLSSNMVAWLQGNCLWTMNVMSNSTAKLVELPKDKFFSSFDYSTESRQFLLSSLATNADSLWRMSLDEPGVLDQIAFEPANHDHSWNDAVWIQGGKGFAYIRDGHGDDFSLVLKADSLVDPEVLFKQTKIEYVRIAPGGQRLFMVGDLNHQPGSGMWEYDIAAKSLRSVVSAFERPLPYLEHVHGCYTNIRLQAKLKLNVLIFPPPNLDSRSAKKYPVVITSIRYVATDPYLSQYAEAIANAGAYFLLIDHTWSPNSLGGWEYNMVNLYSNVVQWPTVDKKRVFLLSNSYQSVGLMDILAKNPGICKGAILQVPGNNLLKPSDLVTNGGKPVRIMVSVEDAPGRREYLKNYQEEACKNGVRVDYFIHPEAPHAFIAKRSQRAAIQDMLDFIFQE